ncbi:MAG TPA: GNAT family N-acetyltransferase [Burkholderiaceae bacterium]|nr:GNAT family N-acetyltransferase [Burkholderiaceae bacterium]
MAATATALRLATAADANAIAVMSRDLIEAGLGWSYRPERIRKLIEEPETAAVVACTAAGIAGFAIMHFGDERAHLVLLAVRREFQRQRIATRLVDWLTVSAMTAGIASLHLELREQNTAARAFYRACGFSETLRVDGYYRGDESALRMVRVLRVPQLEPYRWQPPTRRRRR